VILSPGDTIARDFAFLSNQNLQNVVIEAVPEIARFLTIQPSTFVSVSAGQPQAVRVSLSIPSGTTLGTYDETIHLRIGSSTLPQTLKVVVDVWQGAELAAASATVAVPPGWLIQATPTQISASSPALQTLAGSQDAEVPPQDLLARIFPKSASQPIDQFASGLDGGALTSYAMKSVTTVDGHQGVMYSDVGAGVPHQPVLLAAIDDPVHNQAVVITLQQVVTTGDMQTLFVQLLSAIRFH
jgi:hypothetical protein